MTRIAIACLAVGTLALLAGCGGEAQPAVTVTAEATVTATVTVTATASATATVTPSPSGTATPAAAAPFDLSTDEGLCAADAELSNLELNDALAPLLGFPADRDARSFEQDEAIRAHKNAAFARACPARAS